MAGSPFGVRARAIYRRSWRALVDAKKWDKDAYGNPLVAAPAEAPKKPDAVAPKKPDAPKK